MTNAKKIRNKIKIYIAGKISGLSRSEVLCNFADGELYALNRTNAADVSIFNPPYEIDENMGYWRAMSICLWNLLRADEIYFLPNWLQSRGAKIERAVAEFLKKDIYDIVFTRKCKRGTEVAKWCRN